MSAPGLALLGLGSSKPGWGVWEAAEVPTPCSSEFTSLAALRPPRGCTPSPSPTSCPDVCTRACGLPAQTCPSLRPVNPPHRAAWGEGGLERPGTGKKDADEPQAAVVAKALGLFQLQLPSEGLLRKWSEGGRKRFLSHQASGPGAGRHHLSFQKSLLPASPFSNLWAHCWLCPVFAHTRLPVLCQSPSVPAFTVRGAGTGAAPSTRLCVRSRIRSAPGTRRRARHGSCPWPSPTAAIQDNPRSSVRRGGELRWKTFPDALSILAGGMALPKGNYLGAIKH